MEEHFGWIEILFTGVVGLGFGAWQLWSVNREIARDRKAKELNARPGHPVGEHELDDR